MTTVHASSLITDKPKYVVYCLLRSEITDEQLAMFKRDKFRYQGGN